MDCRSLEHPSSTERTIALLINTKLLKRIYDRCIRRKAEAGYTDIAVGVEVVPCARRIVVAACYTVVHRSGSEGWVTVIAIEDSAGAAANIVPISSGYRIESEQRKYVCESFWA